MNHKPFEYWILNDAPISPKQQQALRNHLANCSQCQRLKIGWEKSKELILNNTSLSPAPGFTQRWKVRLEARKRLQSLLKLRLSISGILFLILASFISYLAAIGSFSHWLAYLFTFISETIFTITKSLSRIETFFSEIPVAISFAAGFLLIVVINAFLYFLLLTCWHYFRKEYSQNEIKIF